MVRFDKFQGCVEGLNMSKISNSSFAWKKLMFSKYMVMMIYINLWSELFKQPKFIILNPVSVGFYSFHYFL